MFGISFNTLPNTEIFADDNIKFAVGNNILNVIHTPGHSPGGVCFIDHAAKIIFPGDVIFRSSIGRTDLAGGDYDTLINSIKMKLFTCCSDDYAIYPGHSESTTIGYERKFNPFL
jgi:glyoxylase-like metal-dependent hydrolase (beta-lactamase superfamily II)